MRKRPRRREWLAAALAALFLTGMNLGDPCLGLAEEPEYRWGVGVWGGAYKFLGAEVDRADVGPEGGLALKYWLNDRVSIGLRGGYGLNEDKVQTAYETSLISGQAELQLNAVTDRPVRPYLLWGVGINVWDSELDGNPILDPMTNEELKGIDASALWGAGLEIAAAPHLIFDLRASASALWRQDDRFALGGVNDANDWRGQASLGIIVPFGKPPKIDTDSDGVLDDFDECANTPYGVVVDAAGCPTDEDEDGVPDGLDKCSGTPVGAVVDLRGCPRDTDGDGVYDGIDVCQATGPSVRVDESGCPIDSDGDGVPEGEDKCPNTPAGTEVDRDGCPVPPPPPPLPERIVLEGVNFRSGTADLLPEALFVLNDAAMELMKRPEVRVEIRGYTDSVGSAETNLRLSQLRADAVRDHLVTRGILPDRLRSVGYGEADPIANNETREGRAKNRRVEFFIMY